MSFNLMQEAKVTYAAPFRKNGDLFRVIINQYTEDQKLLWRYEVWGTLEAVEDIVNINHYPTINNLAEFGIELYEKRISSLNGRPEEYEGLFAITARKIVYGDYRTFPGSIIKNDNE